MTVNPVNVDPHLSVPLPEDDDIGEAGEVSPSPGPAPGPAPQTGKPVVVNMARAEAQGALTEVAAVAVVTQLNIGCHILGGVQGEPGRYVRDDSDFFKKHAKVISAKWEDMALHIGSLEPTFKDIVTIFPMSGRVVWLDSKGETQTTYLLTKGSGRMPKCLEELRAVYAEGKRWNVHDWPQYTEYTKGNDNGPASLMRNTPRLEKGVCSQRSVERSLGKANNNTKKRKILSGLKGAQLIKQRLTKFYNDKSQIYAQKAKKQTNQRLSDQDHAVAKSLKEKADYIESGLNWDAIHSAILNPIHCNDTLDNVVKAATDVTNEHIAEIEGRKGDKFSDPAVKEEKTYARDKTVLSIECEDESKQRLLARRVYEELGITDPKLVPKDPVEFSLVLKMIGTTERAAGANLAQANVGRAVLANPDVDGALCSGSWPENLLSDVEGEVKSIAAAMYDIKNGTLGAIQSNNPVKDFNDALQQLGQKPLENLPS